jgi:hypothetical protein
MIAEGRCALAWVAAKSFLHEFTKIRARAKENIAAKSVLVLLGDQANERAGGKKRMN